MVIEGVPSKLLCQWQIVGSRKYEPTFFVQDHSDQFLWYVNIVCWIILSRWLRPYDVTWCTPPTTTMEPTSWLFNLLNIMIFFPRQHLQVQRNIIPTRKTLGCCLVAQGLSRLLSRLQAMLCSQMLEAKTHQVPTENVVFVWTEKIRVA